MHHPEFFATVALLVPIILVGAAWQLGGHPGAPKGFGWYVFALVSQVIPAVVVEVISLDILAGIMRETPVRTLLVLIMVLGQASSGLVGMAMQAMERREP